jgi:hypothetical protein
MTDALLIMFVLRLRLRCRDLLRTDRLLYRGCSCEYNHCIWRILHCLVRCGVEVVWFCLLTRIVCLLEHQCVESLSEVGNMADSIARSVSVNASTENLQILIAGHATELSWLISIV